MNGVRRKKRTSVLRGSGINPKGFHRSQLKFYAYLMPIAAFMMLPIVFITISAFKPIEELFAYPPRFYVKRPTLNNFIMLLGLSSNTNIPASRYLFNSIASTAVVVLLNLIITSSAGYVFSKKKFKHKELLFNINTLALMFVPVAVGIPRYFIIVYTGLLNSFMAHIIPVLAMPVGLFLVKQFIDQIPDSIIESAAIEGASSYRILRSIVIPMIKPALSTVAILSFQASWNSVEASTMYINNETLKNFAFYMSTLSNSTGNIVAGQGVSAAASLIMFLPNLIIFIVLQSRVMNTMAHSGLK
jgi:multiple sugar transport system permease protein